MKAPLTQIDVQESPLATELPDHTTYSKTFSLNNKILSYDMLYNIVGRRFHDCLKK